MPQNGENSQQYKILLREQANENLKTDSRFGKTDVVSDFGKNGSVGVV